MRTLIAVLTLMVLMSVGPTLLAADDVKTDREGLGERFQDLHLTDAQEAKIAEIRKECGAKVQETAKELAGIVKEEVEKVHAVLTPEQKEKLQTLKEERKEHRHDGLAARVAHLKDLDLTDAELTQIAEIRKEFRPKIEKAMEGLRGVLSDEQRKARAEGLKEGKRRREVLESLKLSDEQKEKVMTIGKEVGTVVREEMEKIRDVLSDEQKAKLQELKEERRERVRDRLACRIANLKELNLTDEQREKINEIRKEYRPRVHEAGNKLRAAVREEVEMILAALKG